jgi:type IV pilus assembly protein PilM
MGMLFKPKKDVIGIDIGSNSVKLVQLKKHKGVYHLETFGMAPLPSETIVDNTIMDSASIKEAVKNLLESQKIKTKNVVTSMSGNSVIIRKILLPMMSEEELESAIQWEAEQYIPFELTDVNLDFQIIGPSREDPSQMNILLVAAKKDVVNDLAMIFKELGLTPQVMDVDCFALENTFEYNYEIPDEAITGLINIGANAINVNVIKNGNSVFTRDIQVGGNLFNEEIQKRMGLSSDDAETVKLGGKIENLDENLLDTVMEDSLNYLCLEIQRSLDFFTATSADERVNKVYITGGVAKCPEIRVRLEQSLGITVEDLNPFLKIVMDENLFDVDYVRSVSPFFSIAAGLAMRRVGDQ